MEVPTFYRLSPRNPDIKDLSCRSVLLLKTKNLSILFRTLSKKTPVLTGIIPSGNLVNDIGLPKSESFE